MKATLIRNEYTQASKSMMSNGTTNVEDEISSIKTQESTGLVKRANVNLTTTSDGYVTVNKSTYKHIISVCPISQASISFVYQANATQWVIFFRNAGTFAPIASTQINADIFYTN